VCQLVAAKRTADGLYFEPLSFESYPRATADFGSSAFCVL
jgi:hypothetical protein